MAETEQNKTEEPTPFKLKRARERGTVARGIDLGFFSALAALSIFMLVAGADAAEQLMLLMRKAFAGLVAAAASPGQVGEAVGRLYPSALNIVALLGATVVVTVALFEIVQIRGLIFSTKPLKPDFSRLDPAKGLKRLFSMRMLKETLKSLLKFAAYSTAAILMVRYAFSTYGASLTDAARLGDAIGAVGLRLLFAFVLLALFFAALDQVLARREFLKQMRMSRGELTREHREREGEPRIKQKRKQLHAEFTKQAANLGDLRGSDMLIVNPQHFAVALAYDAQSMGAPKVTAKGRNNFALALKQRAAQLSLPIFEQPALARALYRACEKGEETPPTHYRSVAALYIKIAEAEKSRDGPADA